MAFAYAARFQFLNQWDGISELDDFGAQLLKGGHLTVVLCHLLPLFVEFVRAVVQDVSVDFAPQTLSPFMDLFFHLSIPKLN